MRINYVLEVCMINPADYSGNVVKGDYAPFQKLAAYDHLNGYLCGYEIQYFDSEIYHEFQIKLQYPSQTIKTETENYGFSII